MSKRTWIILAGVGLAVGIGAILFPYAREAYLVSRITGANVEARGGAAAWDGVDSLRFTGTMEIGQGMEVPFEMLQQRPGKMCLEYEFDGDTVTQCSDGEQGWKDIPFRGPSGPRAMTAEELAEATDGADPRGLLIDSGSRGHQVTRLGRQQVDGRDVDVVSVALPSGSTRQVYLDAASGLEVMVASKRMLAKRERRVETRFSDWKMTDGILIARTQTSQTEGDDASHALTIDAVEINPVIPADRFQMPDPAQTAAAD